MVHFTATVGYPFEAIDDDTITVPVFHVSGSGEGRW